MIKKLVQETCTE